ncbi:translocation/assembly module TamB domain-containing protein [Hyphococcus sp.]|jgi:translocation and assembly module TamB|uniref:translocation/assembly module TamB domain-containing protein n=1 Tax=Hyphococcus sp. TaxID=2038636 RepID=UPI003D098693
MRRIGYIVLGVIAGLLALILLAWFALFYSPPGRTLVKGIVTDQLGAALDSKAEIGSLSGGLPGHIVATDLTLADARGEPWLTAERLELRWRPLGLLRKSIIVDEARLINASLLGDPPESEDPEPEDARQIRVRDSLPRIEIAGLEIDNFKAAINGEQHTLDATGSIRLNGPDIALFLNAQSEAGADQTAIAFAKSPESGRFTLDANLYAEADGIIATLLGLRGQSELRLSGDGPVDEAVITIEGNVGYYGEISAEIAGSFDEFDGADINAAITPGRRFEGVEELSGPVSLSARYDVNRNGGALTIAGLSTAFAEIEGHLDWRAPRGFVEEFNADLNAVLAEDYQPTVQKVAGRDLNIKASLDWRRNDYTLNTTITGPLATLTVRNGRTDLRDSVSGQTRLEAAARQESDFWLTNGLTLDTQLDINFDDAVRLDEAAVTTGDGSRFTGDAAYGLKDKSLTVDGDVVLTPSFAALVLPDATPEGNITGDVKLSGPLDRFTLEAAIEAPALKFEDGTFPPMNLNAALSGLPSLPTGEVSARASNGAPRRLDAQLRSSEDGTIRIPSLSYAGRGFTLGGSAQINADRQTVNLDLTYKGEDNAEPWPGVNAEGAASAKGVLSRDGALNRMTVTADAFAMNDLSVSGLDLTAEGPPGAVRVRAEAAQFETGAAGVISDIAAAGVVNASGPTTLQLNRLEAVIQDNEARLTEPARLDFSDGVGIDTLRLNWGASGTIALDGAFSPQRWRADARLTQVTIPGADGQITGQFALDTNGDIPARGTFTLRSLLLNKEDASISGRAVWNGETLRLTDQESDETLRMDVRLPMRLARQPNISIDTSGELSGEVRYNGDMQAIAAYLPPVLQTIEGLLTADFTLRGTFAEPDVSGRAQLRNGAYTEIESGFSLAGLHAEAEASYSAAGTSSVNLTGGARGAGQSGEDTITFDGDMTLGEESALDFTVNFNNAELSAHPVNQVRADGQLKLSGPLDDLKADGDISITELNAEIIAPESTGLVDIEVVAVDADGDGRPDDLSGPPDDNGLDFEIRIKADDRVFIRGRGLESEWSADVRAVDGREQPVVLGSVNLRRGWLDFSGRRFELTRGSIDFDQQQENDPRLDIRAELNAGDGVTAAIVASGRASDPSIELTSTPSMPSEDVMSLILFGKPAENLSALESLQTAQALASLGGIGPFGGGGGGLTGKLRRVVGLDLLNVDIDPESGGGSLTVGKYVAEGFFVSASQDAQGRNGSVSVKYEITDNITVETELEQEGDQTVSANWKKDF